MTDALLWNELGNIYIKIGSPDVAIAAYTKAIELDPDSGWPYCNLGHAYFLTGEYGRALFLFRKSILLMDTPENQAVVWNKIGDAYRALKDIDNAIQAYKKADDLDMGSSTKEPNQDKRPGNQIFREILKAENGVSESRNLPPDLQKTVTSKIIPVENEIALDGSRPAAMKKGIEEKEISPNPVESMASIPPEPNRINNQENRVSIVGDRQNKLNIIKESEIPSLPQEKPFIVITDRDKGNVLPPKEYRREVDLKQRLNSNGAFPQKETQEEKSNTRTNIGPSVENLEEILAKVNIYENITRVNPASDRAWDTLGKLYKSLSRYKDAIGAYQKAIELAPDKEVYYYYLGLLYSVEQQHDEAVRAFLFVLRKNPEYVLAHSALAGVYHRMGLENKANHHIATALPKMNNESAYNRACFYAICGDNELAFEFLRLALNNKDTTIEWIKSDPDLDPIRSDPRYMELISEKDQPSPENSDENFFSSEVEGTHNRLLPILNNSLAR
jgi:tetratricopeptide (TPR) repeat protein